MISIVLVIKIGLVGVYIGTIVSGLIANITKPYIIYKHILNKPVKEYYLDTIKYLGVLVVSLLAAAVLKHYFMEQVTYLSFAIMFLAITVIFNGIYLILFRRNEEFQYLVNLLKGKLKKKTN